MESKMENKMETNIGSQNCKMCVYFFSCDMERTDLFEFCSTHPETLGYCELWEGSIKKDTVCHGWTKR